MFPPRLALLHAAMLPALLLPASGASADLQAIGHEFRPSAAERTGSNPCTTEDGSTVSLAFVCNDGSNSSYCPWPLKGKLYAEWRSSGGELEGDPVFIAEGGYSYGLPYTCAPDGSVGVVLDNDFLQVVDRDGARGTASKVCDSQYCSGLVGIGARQDGYLLSWSTYSSGFHGRLFNPDGQARDGPFLIDGPPSDRTISIANHLTPAGDVLLAWETETTTIRAAIVRADGSVVPAVAVSEFPSIEYRTPIAIHAEAPDRFVVSWKNDQHQAGWVARRLVDGEEQPTTTTSTTTTTMFDSTTSFLPSILVGQPGYSSGEYRIDQPDLAADDAGRWFADWTDRVPEVNGYVGGTRSSLSTDDARQWSDPEPFHTADYLASRSMVTGNGHGILVDVFARHGWEDGLSVLSRRSTDGGASWSEPLPIYESGYGGFDYDSGIYYVALAAGADGRWVAAWTESISFHAPCSTPDCIDWEDVSVFCGARYAVSKDDGVSWSSPQELFSGVCGFGSNLQITTDGGDNWLIVWPDWRRHSIRGAVSNDGGDSFQPPRDVISNAYPEGWSFSLAASAEGRWLLAWSVELFDESYGWPEGEYTRVLVSTADDPFGPWSSPAGIAPWHDVVEGRDLYPSVAANEDGVFGIAWSTHSSGSGLDADIVAAFSDDGGESWSRPNTIDSLAHEDGARDSGPRMISNGPTWAAIWRTSEQQSHGIRFARTRGNCGNGDVDANEACDDGNLVEGDGCDTTCLLTGCGSGVVTEGEQCDDGNDDDSDACIACEHAFCGDGYVQSGVEECDDANDIDADDCLNACTLARCGDGVELAGIEACDDGDATGNNDACLDACEPSACGDGYLRLGKEDCDDGNGTNDDGCSNQCRLETDCLFFGSDGRRVTASDSLKVLRRAVGMNTRCPLHDCDVSRDGALTAIDALWTLRSAVGIFADGCSLPDRLVLRMTSGETFGSLQVRIDYADAAGHVEAKSNGRAACTSVAAAPFYSVNWLEDEGVLQVGFLSLEGIQGPVDLLSCLWDPISGPSLHDFVVTIEEASDTSTLAIEPPPVVTLTAE